MIAIALDFCIKYLKKYWLIFLIFGVLLYSLHYEYKKGQRVCEQTVEVKAIENKEKLEQKTQEVHYNNEVKKSKIIIKRQTNNSNDALDSCILSHNPYKFNCM